MYQYDQTITTTAKNYNIQERDVIFCHLVASGVTRADAFHVIYNRNTRGSHTTQAEADTEAAELLKNKPGTKILIQKLKAKATINTPTTQDEVRRTEREEEEEPEQAKELQSREGLTKKLRNELVSLHGKDSVQGLISLAKLEGYDKEDTRTEEERRKFVLPSITRCQNCQLLRIFEESI